MRTRVRSLALLSGLRTRRFMAVNCGVDCSLGSDPMLLWLWCRPAAAAPILPLTWEPPYAAGAAPKRHTHTKHRFSRFLLYRGALVKGDSLRFWTQPSHRSRRPASCCPGAASADVSGPGRAFRGPCWVGSVQPPRPGQSGRQSAPANSEQSARSGPAAPPWGPEENSPCLRASRRPSGFRSPPTATSRPHLARADVASLREPIVLHEELAWGQGLSGTWHVLREELLDLFDGPQVEGPLFGPHAPLWRRVRVLGTVEASRLWGGESWLPQPLEQGRPQTLPQPGRPACLSGHTPGDSGSGPRTAECLWRHRSRTRHQRSEGGGRRL